MTATASAPSTMSAAPVPTPAGQLGPPRLAGRWLVAGLGSVVVAAVAGIALGPVALDPVSVVRELLDGLPGVTLDSGLTPTGAAIVWDLRLPRVCLGLLVGAALALSGGSYQGVFRNPLADPYLLGVAAGAGLGATIAIVAGAGTFAAPLGAVPAAAFAGALVAVGLTAVLGGVGRGARPATLLLAGVAVASFLTAVQTYVQQRDANDSFRQVFNWVLGRLSGASWAEVRLLLPLVVVTSVVLLSQRRALDVLAVGDEEAAALGLSPVRTRWVVVVAAALLTAAAVSMSGLIGFVGIIVPHTVRLVAGASHRLVLPLSVLFGGAFLTLADVLARTLLSPAEIPIGVVTAFFGAPFFVVVLRTSERVA